MRPEGWEDLKPTNDKVITMTKEEHFEAGADAMLEGLRGEGQHTNTLPPNFSINVDKKGWLVFIPEENVIDL